MLLFRTGTILVLLNKTRICSCVHPSVVKPKIPLSAHGHSSHSFRPSTKRNLRGVFYLYIIIKDAHYVCVIGILETPCVPLFNIFFPICHFCYSFH